MIFTVVFKSHFLQEKRCVHERIPALFNHLLWWKETLSQHCSAEKQFMSPQLPLYLLGMKPLGIEHEDIILYYYLLMLFNYILIYYYCYYYLLEWERQGSGRETRKGGRGWEMDLVKDIGVWQSPARQPSYCTAVSGLSIEAI